MIISPVIHHENTQRLEREAYGNLAKHVLQQALIDGDICFFQQKDNLWLDMFNSVMGYNLTGKFFIGIIEGQFMGKVGLQLVADYLYPFGLYHADLVKRLARHWRKNGLFISGYSTLRELSETMDSKNS